MTTEEIINQITEIVIDYGPRVLGAITVLIVGTLIIKGITKGFVKFLNRRNIDESLKPFLKGMVNILLRVLLVISILGMLGIEMTSFIAILGAAGLAVGLALSGTLQNFAGGVMILAFKPFKVGDYVDAQGYTGTVNEIQIFNTVLKTVDNKTVIIPNGGLSTSAITNYSSEKTRRVDWTFGIGYGDNAEKAKEVLKNLCSKEKRILNEPELFIAISELSDSSVNFAVRAWVKSEDYWDVFFWLNEEVYNAFEKEGLNIPYPQMDVHLHNK